MSLKRIKEFAGFYKNEEIIWDLCCDHGELAKILHLNNPKITKVYLVDRSRPVVEKLIEKFPQNKYPNFHIMNADIHCVDDIICNRPQLIYLLGVGGNQCISFLAKYWDHLSPTSRLIVSPHSHLLRFRRYLVNQKIGVEQESLLEENSQFYEAFVLSKGSNESTNLHSLKIFDHSHLARLYAEKLKKQFEKQRDRSSCEFLDFLNKKYSAVK